MKKIKWNVAQIIENRTCKRIQYYYLGHWKVQILINLKYGTYWIYFNLLLSAYLLCVTELNITGIELEVYMEYFLFVTVEMNILYWQLCIMMWKSCIFATVATCVFINAVFHCHFHSIKKNMTSNWIWLYLSVLYHQYSTSYHQCSL